MRKVIYYYQTFTGLEYLLNIECKTITHINISSIHFGKNNDGTNYIHLNDNIPKDKLFDSVWQECEEASNFCKIYLMLGGAGGAYTQLFSDFENYYKLLHDLIKSKKFITGIDLDIEEFVSLENTVKLIKRLKHDFGNNFDISMAPLSVSLENDTVGIGGFIYKELYKQVGNMISHFNAQCYYDMSDNIIGNIVNNGYPEEKIVLGMISSQDFNQNINIIVKLNQTYKQFGVYNWEYFDSPPGFPGRPDIWGEIMCYLLNNS
jgi:hypothetical protein